MSTDELGMRYAIMCGHETFRHDWYKFRILTNKTKKNERAPVPVFLYILGSICTKAIIISEKYIHERGQNVIELFSLFQVFPHIVHELSQTPSLNVVIGCEDGSFSRWAHA